MPNLTVYFPEQLHQQLRQRGLGDGENVVKRDLERYYALLELSLKRVAFSEAEWDYLRDAMNGIIFSQELIPYLPRALPDPPAAVAAGGFLFLPSPPFVSCFVSVCVIELDKITRGDTDGNEAGLGRSALHHSSSGRRVTCGHTL